jgi:hypothetical protein
MPDNLTINITATTDQAEVNIAKVEARLRALTRERKKAADEFEKTGDDKRLKAVIPTLAATTKELAGLRKETDRTGSAIDALATKSVRRLLTQFDNVGKSASNIAMVLGGVTGSFAGGFLAASVFAGIAKLVNGLDAVAERLKKIRDEAQKTGQSPLAVQAGERISERAGQKPDALSGFMTGVAEAAAAAQTAGKELTGGVKVMRGSMGAAGDDAKEMGSQITKGVTLLRGSSPLTLDLAKVYDMLGVSMKGVTGAGDSLLKKQLEVAEAFVRQQKSFNPLQLNEIAKALKFESADVALKLLPDKIKAIRAEIDKLNASPSGITPEAILSQETADGAKARVDQIFQDWNASLWKFRNQLTTESNNWVADFIEKTLPAWKQGFLNFWPQLIQDFKNAWADTAALFPEDMFKPLTDMFQTAIDWVTEAWKNTVDWIVQKAREISDAIRKGVSSVTGGAAAGDPSIPAMPARAAGGMIHGPGSGTSDSILARLSNGEFVMRAAAVSKWGPRFFAALNGMQNPFGYAGGGLVPRFAAGGLVAGGAGGTPVHLHLGGQSFALSGAQGVVSSLVTEAHRQRMRSAGTKPSWYGGH